MKTLNEAIIKRLNDPEYTLEKDRKDRERKRAELQQMVKGNPGMENLLKALALDGPIRS